MRRSYAGGANTVILANPISAGDGSLLAGTTPLGWPDGSNGPFAIVVGKGLANEEKMLVSARTGGAYAISQRGYDGTTAGSHSNPETIQMCNTGIDADEANAHVNASTGVHGLAALDRVAGIDAVQTLTHKTIDGVANTLQNIPRAASPQIDSKLTDLDTANATQDTNIAAKVAKAGDTMTGLLVLSGTPVADLGAANKKYVDDGLTAESTARSNADALKAPINNPTFTGTVTLAGDAAAALQATTKQQMDAGLALKAPIASPTFTGTVTLPADGASGLQAASYQQVAALIAGRFEWGISTLNPDVNGNVTIPHGSYTPAGLFLQEVGPGGNGTWAGQFRPVIRSLGPGSVVHCFHTADGTPVASGSVTIHWLAIKP